MKQYQVLHSTPMPKKKQRWLIPLSHNKGTNNEQSEFDRSQDRQRKRY